MLTTDTQLDIRTLAPTTLNPDFYQRAYPITVNRHKGILGVNLSVGVMVQESTCIITADSKRGLCQIIRAEREKLRLSREII